MGQEAKCTVRFNGQSADGRALLETTELLFRGGFRLVIPFKDIEGLEADERALRVRFPAGEAVFELGAQAAKWAQKIRNPRGLLDKLGVKAGQVVSVIDVRDEGFLEQLKERIGGFTEGTPARDSDLIFYGAGSVPDLERLEPLRDQLKRNGAIWVISPKGQPHIRESDVMAAAKAAGLVDVKVAAFSSTHTAAKLVIPVAMR